MFKEVIQIAGIIDRGEAEMLLECGADLLGFPLRLAVHREDLSEAAAAEIIRCLPDPSRAVLITYLDNAGEIVEFCAELGVGIVQLHGPVAVSELRRLRKIQPNLRIVKSLVVHENNRRQLLREMEEFSLLVDAFLTDTYDPESRASGATGKVHDWRISRELAEHSPKPLILAGGLTPENVYEAVRYVKPDGVDAHTGVEAPNGSKDRQKVLRFIAEARRAFSQLQGAQAVEIPINGVLDLHTFNPREIKELVPEYLSACREKGIYSVRIIHGKGTGTLRRTVQSILTKSPLVESFETVDDSGGGWGATSVKICEV